MTSHTATPARPCRYCGETPHVPADACLTASQKVGRVFALTVLWALGLTILVVLFLAVAAMH